MFNPKFASDEERKCIRIFADLFASGIVTMSADAARQKFQEEELAKTTIEYNVLIRTMDGYGVVQILMELTNKEQTPEMFRILPGSLQRKRELDEFEKQSDEPGDIVEQFKGKVRRNSIIAWILIVFFVVVALIAGINQAIDLLQKIGWMEKPK